MTTTCLTPAFLSSQARAKSELVPVVEAIHARLPGVPISIDTTKRAVAEAALDALKLGQGPGTDYLAISFSALDLVGHSYGPRSHEVQDVLARLDRTPADLRLKADVLAARRIVGEEHEGQRVVGISLVGTADLLVLATHVEQAGLAVIAAIRGARLVTRLQVPQ